MRIGYCVEGSTDRALLQGLKTRWCPHAQLVQGKFRGEFRRREMANACFELQSKGADLIVLLRDANDEAWREVAREDAKACGSAHQHMVVVGVCDRNVECWLVNDTQYAEKRIGCPAADFSKPDPKNAFNRAMGITALDSKEPEISEYVQFAPLDRWLSNKSFEDFYESLRLQSKRLDCKLENLRES
jgi:hypothetical protein